MTVPTPQNSEVVQVLVLFNAAVTALATLSSFVVTLARWLLHRGARTGEQIVEGSRLNQMDKETVLRQFRQLRWACRILLGAVVVSGALSLFIWLVTRPPERRDITGLKATFTSLDFNKDKWAATNPIFAPILVQLAEEGQAAENKKTIRDFRLFKAETEAVGAFTEGRPTNGGHLRITYPKEQYRVVLHAFLVREFEGSRSFELLPAKTLDGAVDIDVPAAEPGNRLLFVGRVTSKETKLSESYEHIFTVEVRKQ